MKYINKGEEPESFKSWKALAKSTLNWGYNYLQNPEKRELHRSLVCEQGYICCYCGMGITRETSHIEHLKPQSSTDSDLSLDYINLLASCQRERKEPLHCAYKKDDWYQEHLMVSPLDTNCTDFFRYSGSGDILPTADPGKQTAAETTINKLGLNINKMRAMRIEAIDGGLQAIDGLTNEQIQQLVQGYEQPNAEGKHTPFCAAIVYILKQFL